MSLTENQLGTLSLIGFFLSHFLVLLLIEDFRADLWGLFQKCRRSTQKKETPPEPKKPTGETAHPFRTNARVESSDPLVIVIEIKLPKDPGQG